MTSLVTKKEVMTAIYPFFEQDSNCVLLAGDMGFSVLDNYLENYPERAFNTGINEQATISMAAGLAATGMLPIVYSQIPFITMRAFEQLRYDINEHNTKIIIVGVGANNYFHKLGRSHCMDNDDIKLFKLLNNFIIINSSSTTLRHDIKRAFEHSGPVYIRSL